MTRPYTLRGALGGGLVLLVAATSFAQGAQTISLKPANATLTRDFTIIRSARELSDGRVLITDDLAYVVDFRTNTVQQVGRIGDGPGEYRTPSQLTALRGDTTYMTGGARWTVFAGDRIVATVTPNERLVGVTKVGVLFGADRADALLTMQHAARPGGNASAPADSPFVVRVRRATTVTDTLTRLRPMPQGVVSGTFKDGRGNSYPMYRVSEYSVMEEAAFFQDGWVAIARLRPYRVDWIAPDGQHVKGPALAAQTLDTYREQLARAERMSRRTGKPAYRVVEAEIDQTRIIPEFEIRPLLTVTDGRLAVKRMQTASFEMTRYDLIDRQGKLSVQLRMPETERIVAFGKQAVYVAVRDEDGIEHLRRHSWP